jgi:tRNA pseudouridine-54 N-methylase
MREKGRVSPSRQVAFILYSLKSKTSFKGDEWRGYASRTSRLDIPVRTAYLLYSSKASQKIENLEVSIISYGPPDPPLHIHLEKGFFQRKSFLNERELMKFFLQTIFNKETKGLGWFRERKGLLEVINFYRKRGYTPVLLRESRTPVIHHMEKPLYLLGTDFDIPPSYMRFLGQLEIQSLGPTSYLASHVALSFLIFQSFPEILSNIREECFRENGYMRPIQVNRG